MDDQVSDRVAIIISHGTIDAAYAALIVATGAAAMGMEAAIFCTFYGLEILKQGKADHLKVSPVGNPAMPVKIPNIVGMLPGMTAAATGMMNKWMADANVAKVSELLDIAKETEVRLIACQMTMDVMHVKQEDLMDGVEIGGVATFLEYAGHNAITLTF
jgi:peroxiredoxin family protein